MQNPYESPMAPPAMPSTPVFRTVLLVIALLGVSLFVSCVSGVVAHEIAFSYFTDAEQTERPGDYVDEDELSSERSDALLLLTLGGFIATMSVCGIIAFIVLKRFSTRT